MVLNYNSLGAPVYWPGMNSEIHDRIAKCSICQQHQKLNAKEPMIPSQVPSKPWENIATDLFTWDKSEYLIIEVQWTTDNSNLLGKSKKVRVIPSLKQITWNKQMDGEGMQLSNKIYRDGHWLRIRVTKNKYKELTRLFWNKSNVSDFSTRVFSNLSRS